MVNASRESAAIENVHRLGKSADKAKTAVADTIEDGKMAAERLLKRGRFVVEDNVAESVHRIRRNPVISVALAFTAGLISGFLVSYVRRPVRNGPEQ